MKRLTIVIIPVLILLTLIVWRLHTKAVDEAAQSKMHDAMTKAAPLVTVAAASEREVQQTFEGVGSMEAPLNVKIACKTSGRIDFLTVREGDKVSRNEVLVRIDPSELEAQVMQQKAAVAEARSRLAEARITQSPANVSVLTQIRQMQAALDSANADYNQTKQNYNAQVAAAESVVTDDQGEVDAAKSAVANAQAAIRSAQADVTNASTHYNRIHQLYVQGFIAAQDVDDARTAVSVQQASLDVTRGQLDAANSQLGSATAEKAGAQKQEEIAVTSGKANIEAARARVTQAREALKYAIANRAQTPAYAANLNALQAVVDAAVANVNNAEAQLTQTVLVSPIDGYVANRYMDPGSVATAGQSILEIQSVGDIWVTVPVPEEVSRRIYSGQSASVVLDALPGRTFTGKVSHIDPAADPSSRRFNVRVTILNANGQIKPGMFAQATFVIEKSRAVVVPPEAIQQGKSGLTVTVIDNNGVAHVRPVETGMSVADGVAVLNGVAPGDHVLTLTSRPIKDGQRVRVGIIKPAKAARTAPAQSY